MSSPLVVRAARPEDVTVITETVRVAYAVYVARIGRRPAPMDDDYERRTARGEAWVIDDADGVAGILILEDGPDALLLENVAVRPRAQGRGIGRALLAFAETQARRRGHGRIDLYTNVAMIENIALYERAGYTRTGVGDAHGFTRVFMSKDVSSHD